MAPELSQSSEAVKLIPGDPAKLYQTVAGLSQYADLMTAAANGLSEIDVTSGWSGPAATAFVNAYHPQPSRWQQAGEAFRDAATAVDNFAQALDSAQQQAAIAAPLLQAGDKTTQTQGQLILDDAQGALTKAAGQAVTALTDAVKNAPRESFLSKIGSAFDAAVHDPAALAELVGGGALAIGGMVAMDSLVGGPLGVAADLGGGALMIAGAYQITHDESTVPGASGVSASSAAPATAQQITDQAAQLGFGREVPQQQAPFNSNGQPVYTDGGSYITPDGDGWVLLDKYGTVLGTYDWNLTLATGTGS